MPSHLLNLFQAPAELPAFAYEILKLVVPALVGIVPTYYLMRSQQRKIQADIFIEDSKQSILNRQDRDYWMKRFEDGLEETIEQEKEIAEHEIWKKSSIRLFKKLRRSLPDCEGFDIGLLDDIDELLLEAE